MAIFNNKLQTFTGGYLDEHTLVGLATHSPDHKRSSPIGSRLAWHMQNATDWFITSKTAHQQ
jgi:hypothetical protein